MKFTAMTVNIQQMFVVFNFFGYIYCYNSKNGAITGFSRSNQDA